MEDKTATIVGIDLGTTYSCAAIHKNGNIVVLANQDDGARITPSYVSFTQGQTLVGVPAKLKQLTNPENTVYDVKRMLGKSYTDSTIETNKRYWFFTVVKGSENQAALSVHCNNKTTTMDPEDISALVLKKMKEITEAYIGTIHKAVVTVPAYFNMQQKQATINAATKANLEVVELITEPAAAAYAYGFDHKKFNKFNLLVIDLGGGTFDVVIMKAEGGRFQVVSIGGDTNLGGRDFDNMLFEHCAIELLMKYDKNLRDEKSKKIRHKLLKECETLKKTLSSATEGSIDLSNFFPDLDDVEFEITRATFESVCKDLFGRIRKIITDLLDEAKFKPSDINKVLLVGGASRMPKIKEILLENFDENKLHQKMHADEAVVVGAAVRAAQLCPVIGTQMLEISLIEATPLSLGIRHSEQRVSFIIPRNSLIPTKRSQSYWTTTNDQTSALIQVFEGLRPLLSNCHYLGEFTLTGLPPGAAGTVKFEVIFELDKNGILHATAKHGSLIAKHEINIAHAPLGTNTDGVLKDATIAEDRDKIEYEHRQALPKSKHFLLPNPVDYASLRILRIIDRGTDGIVYSATLFNRGVAVKELLKKKFDARVIQKMCRLNHENVVQLITYCQDPFCLVMELYPKDLNIIIEEELISFENFKKFSLQLATGMQYLHEEDVVHRDLKPQNILLTSEMDIKICDFEHSKEIDFSAASMSTQVGTYAWMAPEMLGMMNPDDRYKKAIDTWSYGVILWQLVMQKTPFHSIVEDLKRPGRLFPFWKDLSEGKIRLPVPGDAPPFIRTMIQACLQIDHSKRPKFGIIVERFCHEFATTDFPLWDELKQVWKESNIIYNVGINKNPELPNAPCDNYPQVNILVLGVTGVGKSTWINAIANYITYETLEEAESHPLINLIPTQFDMTVDRNGELDVQRFQIGVSENESYDKKGQACTQFPRPYTFTHNGTLYRIIDTPGIADSRGLNQDKINMENIMRFIARYDEIHAICIFMMPNECRLTAQFEFCFNELLMQFHRSAVNNIVFCFTHTSSYNFNVSDTLLPLRALINEIKKRRQVEFTISNDKCYPFDNMTYRYLCATQPEYDFPFTDDQVAVYKKAYDISRSTTSRLFEHVLKQTPHNAKDSMSVYHARNVILKLTVPLAKINVSVQLTIQIIKEREKTISECGDDLDALSEALMIKFTEEKSEEDKTAASIMQAKQKTKEEIVKQIEEQQQLHKEYVAENKQILVALAKFALFLTCHSITPYNDATEKHLRVQIELAQKMNDTKKEKISTDLLRRYHEEKEILENAMRNASDSRGSAVEPAAIMGLVIELQSMKHYGRDIVDALKMVENSVAAGDPKGRQADHHFSSNDRQSRYLGEKDGKEGKTMIEKASGVFQYMKNQFRGN